MDNIRKLAEASPDDAITLDDFVAYLPAHSYMFIYTRAVALRIGERAGVPYPRPRQ